MPPFLLVQHFFKTAKREKTLFFHPLFLITSLLTAYFLSQTAPLERTQIAFVLMGEITRILCFLITTIMISSYSSKIKSTSEYDLFYINAPHSIYIPMQLFLCGIIIYTTLMALSLLIHFLFMPHSMAELTTFTYATALFLEGTFIVLGILFFTQRLSNTKVVITMGFAYLLARLKSSILLTFSGLLSDESKTMNSALKAFFFFIPDLSNAPLFIGAPFSFGTFLIDITSISISLIALIFFQNKRSQRCA